MPRRQGWLPPARQLEHERIRTVEFLGEEDPGKPSCAAGLVDIQINGFAGVSFSSSKLSVDDLARVPPRRQEGPRQDRPRGRLPLTAPQCVGTLVTDGAVFRRRERQMTWVSIHCDYSREDVLGCINCELPVADEMEAWDG